MVYRIGIDEVGRGPIAGPLVVCACAVREGFDTLSLFPKGILKDSKKLSEKHRKNIFAMLTPFIENKTIIYGLGEITAEEIDLAGLSMAIKNAIQKALDGLHMQGVDENNSLYLDGSLHADTIRYSHQETIIKGDEKIAEISLASIIAKVYRDDVMKKIAETYKCYGFETNVGYGTAFHYKGIEKYGLSEYHRKSFLKKML